MITIEKIKIWEKFEGDIDGFSIVGSTEDKETISDSEWYEIDKFVQRLHSEYKALSSVDFNIETKRLMKLAVERDAIEYLQKIVSENR